MIVFWNILSISRGESENGVLLYLYTLRSFSLSPLDIFYVKPLLPELVKAEKWDSFGRPLLPRLPLG